MDIKLRVKAGGQWIYFKPSDHFQPRDTEQGHGPVDWTTLSLYTGFNDKVGKEIYGGDRIVIDGEPEDYVYWNTKKGQWYISSSSEAIGDDELAEFISQALVIGDIYTNR